MTAQQGLRQSLAAARTGDLFSAIEANYTDAVRLLATAHSARFDGEATLFVAERTLKPGVDARQSWAPWISALQVWSVDCAHVDMITPEAFAFIGPLINQRLNAD